MKKVVETYSEIDREGKIVRKTRPKKRQGARINGQDYHIFNLGYYLLTPLLMGVFLGLTIDNYFHTKPVFTLGLIFLGMFASFYNLYKIFKNNAKN